MIVNSVNVIVNSVNVIVNSVNVIVNSVKPFKYKALKPPKILKSIKKVKNQQKGKTESEDFLWISFT